MFLKCSVVTGKGVYSILSAEEWDDVFEIAVGEVVHVSRYARYTNKRSIEQDKKNLVVTLLTTKKAGLRSSDAFDYISQCLYCRNTVTQWERRDKKAD